MKTRSAKIKFRIINGIEYIYIITRDKHGISRRKYKRICVGCKKEDWLLITFIKKKQFYCRSCKGKFSMTKEKREKISKTLRKKYQSPSYKEMMKKIMGKVAPKKEKHWNWKGGITPINQTERNSDKFKTWRRKVFERDLYHCRICKKNYTKLNAHHIFCWSSFPDLRYDINNGITLCERCHKIIHLYFKEVENGS